MGIDNISIEEMDFFYRGLGYKVKQIGPSTPQAYDANFQTFELIAQTRNFGTTCIGIHISKWTVFGNSMERFVDEIPNFRIQTKGRSSDSIEIVFHLLVVVRIITIWWEFFFFRMT